MSQHGPVTQQRKKAVYALLIFCIVWIVGIFTVQVVYSVKVGYGTFYHNSGRVPPDFIEKHKLPANVTLAEAVKLTSEQNVPEMSAAEDAGRLLLSIALELGLLFFWYRVLSRIGTF